MKRILDLPWQRWVLAAIVLLAMTLRYEGLNRPMFMHPDEMDIRNWMENTRQHGHLKGITYPAGFFVIAEAARSVYELVAFRPWQHFLYLTGVSNRVVPHLEPFDFGRHFNVWLGSLTVILIYLLCRRVSGSRVAGLFGATLFTLAPYHIEHSHYLETDIAMVAMLALSLWLWARHAQNPRWGRYAAAAIATGFAVGTKTTLVFLVPLVVLFGSGWPDDSRPGRIFWFDRRRALRVLSGLVLVGGGFVWSTREALNVGAYLASYREMIAGVYLETKGILGPAHAEPWAHQIYLLHNLQEYLGSVGAGWLLLAAAGVPLLLTRARRCFWPLTLLFPALYLYYFVFQAPWVRTQEFMNFLPSFALSASVVAAWLLDRAGRSRFGITARVATALLLGVLIVPTAQLGIAVASRCGWPDTRVLAQSWLRRHLPYKSTITAEQYTTPASFDVVQSEVEILQKVETHGLPFMLENGVDYFVRNVTVQNRGLIDPRTTALYPDAQAKLDALRRGAELLRSWSVIDPGRPFVSFRSPLLELWGLRPPSSGPTLDVSLPQPLYVSEAGRETFFQAGHLFGATEGVLLQRYARDLAVGGPVAPGKGVFVVVNTQGLPARVDIKGFGRNHTRDLDSFDAVAIQLRRPWWSPRFDSYERIRAWTEARRHVVLQPCWLRLAYDATEAARLLDELGRPDRAWEVLQANGGGTDPGLAFGLAVRTGNAAAALAPAAKAQMERLAKVLREGIATVRLNGLSATRHDEFARFHLRGRDEVMTLKWEQSNGENSAKSIVAVQSLPLRMAGPSIVRMDVRIHGKKGFQSSAPKIDEGNFELRDAEDRLLYRGAIRDFSTDVFRPLAISLPGAAHERAVILRWTSPQPGTLEIRNVEVEWGIAGTLRARLLTQGISLARWNLLRRSLPEALAIRSAIPEPGTGDFDVDLRRLDFELALALGDPPAIEQAARRLLDKAPRHYKALRALAGNDPRSASIPAALDGEGEAAVFTPFAAIRRASVGDGRLRLVIEALSDETPALGVELRERRINRWREQPGRVMISAERPLHAGERVAVELPLGETKLARLGVSVVSNNPFVGGDLLSRGENTLPVVDLVRASAGGE